MTLEFVGDIENIAEPQFDLFREAFKNHGYEEGTVTIEPVGKVGDNYLANIKRLTIQGRNEPFKMVAKVAPKQEMMRAMTNTSLAFQNESFMYLEVLPKLTELQKYVGTPDEDILRYPACYGVSNEAPNETIILEDLKELGFGIRDRFSSLTDDEVRVMLKNLAILHGLGFVLKEKEPEWYLKAKEKLISLWELFADSKEFKKGLETAEVGVMSMLDSELHKELAKGKISNALEFTKEFAKKEANSSHVCIIQGDCWTNNIMFRTNDGHTDCIMIDYQVSHVSSPVLDLMYFIFNCTDRDTRKDNYFKWIDYYYSIFSKTLSRFDLKASNVYSRVAIHKDLASYGIYMYGLAVMFLNILTRDTEEIKDIKTMTDEEFKQGMDNMDEYYDVNKLKSASYERFKSRLIGLTESFIEYGYI